METGQKDNEKITDLNYQDIVKRKNHLFKRLKIALFFAISERELYTILFICNIINNIPFLVTIYPDIQQVERLRRKNRKT